MEEEAEETVIEIQIEIVDESRYTTIAHTLKVDDEYIDWFYLEKELKVCCNQNTIKVYYIDDDEEEVAIDSEDELREAFKVARKCNNKLNMLVICANHIDHMNPDHTEIQLDSSYACGQDFHSRSKTMPDSIKRIKERNIAEALRCFYLCCSETGMVLDIYGGGTYSGTPVILWPRKPLEQGVRNQLWRQDGNVIRSLLNGFCLDVHESAVVVEPYDAYKSIKHSQQWYLHGQRLSNDETSNGVSMGLSKPITGAGQAIQVGPVTELKCLNLVKVYDDSQLVGDEAYDWPNELTRRVLYDDCCSERPIRLPVMTENKHHKFSPYVEAVHHFGVVCDMCDKDIVGVRYKCCSCVNYDLCETCEEEEVHDKSHILLKIRVPIDRQANPGIDPYLIPLSLADQYRVKVDTFIDGLQDEKDTEPSCGISSMNAEFVKDQNFPAGTRVQPGTKLTKKWIVRNSGTMPWASKTVLRHNSGSIVYSAAQVSVPYVQPGFVGTLMVDLIVPDLPGHYDSYWQLFSHEKSFGPIFSCEITVDEKHGLEVTSGKEMSNDKFRSIVRDADQLMSADNTTWIALYNHINHSEDQEAFEDFENEEEEEEEEDNEENEHHMTVLSTTTHAPDSNDTESIDTADGVISDEYLPLGPVHTRPINYRHDNDYDAMHGSMSDLFICSANDTEYIATADGVIPEEYLPSSRPVYVLHATPINNLPDNEYDIMQDNTSDLSVISDYEYVSSVSTTNDSSDSDSLSEEEDDFHIVPIPDCFNTELPARMEASTSVLVKKSDMTGSSLVNLNSSTPHDISVRNEILIGNEEVSVVEDWIESNVSESEDSDYEAVVPCDVSQVRGVDGAECDVLETRVEDASGAVGDGEKGVAGAVGEGVKGVTGAEGEGEMDVTGAVGDRVEESKDDEDKFAEAEACGGCEAGHTHPKVNGEDDVDPQEQSCESSDEEDEESSDNQTRDARHKHQKIEGLMFSVMSSAVGAASKAATGAFSTLKDVYHTLQAKNTYTAPKSTWTPSTNVWMPPSNSWTSEQREWTPSTEAWTPATVPWTPPQSNWKWMPVQPNCLPTQQWVPCEASDSVTDLVEGIAVNAHLPYRPSSNGDTSAMQQLIEMGFANRELNALVLTECNDDLQMAIQRIIQMDDNHGEA